MYNTHLLAGVDEAGRGALCGPVVAAAVILPPHLVLNGLNDSKKLTAKKRTQLAQLIKKQALSYAIAEASPLEIDQLNILQASLLAMQRAVDQLSITPEAAIIDGTHAPNLNVPTTTLIKGDSLVPAISAASILAKVHRDTLMQQLDSHYPNYQLAQHKGYPTKIHQAALKKYGPTAIHRKTFKPVTDCLSIH